MTHHAPITPAPVNLRYFSAHQAARQVSDACLVLHHQNAMSAGPEWTQYEDHLAKDGLERLAALFGARLVWEDER